MKFLIRLAIVFLILFSFNAFSKTVNGYSDGKKLIFEASPIKVRDFKGRQIFLEVNAAEEFNNLMVDAALAGLYIGVNYGYRTFEQQKFWHRTFEEKCKSNSRFCGMAAKPGFSSHQEGKSVDIIGCVKYFNKKKINQLNEEAQNQVKEKCLPTGNGSYMCRTILYWWLKRNAPSYGFQNDVLDEPWHWTFYGSEDIEVGG